MIIRCYFPKFTEELNCFKIVHVLPLINKQWGSSKYVQHHRNSAVTIMTFVKIDKCWYSSVRVNRTERWDLANTHVHLPIIHDHFCSCAVLDTNSQVETTVIVGNHRENFHMCWWTCSMQMTRIYLILIVRMDSKLCPVCCIKDSMQYKFVNALDSEKTSWLACADGSVMCEM